MGQGLMQAAGRDHDGCDAVQCTGAAPAGSIAAGPHLGPCYFLWLPVGLCACPVHPIPKHPTDMLFMSSPWYTYVFDCQGFALPAARVHLDWYRMAVCMPLVLDAGSPSTSGSAKSWSTQARPTPDVQLQLQRAVPRSEDLAKNWFPICSALIGIAKILRHEQAKKVISLQCIRAYEKPVWRCGSRKILSEPVQV